MRRPGLHPAARRPTSEAAPSAQEVARADGWFVAAACAVVGLAIALALSVASLEWFSRDDFAFLLYVQKPWSWQRAFLPLESGFWWAWRPIGMDAYFYLCHRAFGLEFPGWFAVGLLVHLARFPLVWRLARQLSLRGPTPWIAATLSVTAAPSLTEFYYPAVFHYGSAVLLGTLSLTLLLDAARGSRLALLGSALAFTAALLCNESALVLAPVGVLLLLFRAGFSDLRRALPRALRRTAPHFAIAGVWAALRYGVVATKPAPDWYAPRLGSNLLHHFWYEPVALAGGEARLVALLLLLFAVVAFSWRWRGRPGDAVRRQLLHANLALVPWLLAGVAVFASLPLAQVRFAIALEVPAALIVAACLDALWQRLGAAHGTTLQIGFAALLLLAVPLEAIGDRRQALRGAPARDYVEAVSRAHPQLPAGVRVRILYGGEGRATEQQSYRFRVETYMGHALRAVQPDLEVRRVEFLDASGGPPPPCPRCITFDLGPDLRIRPFDYAAQR